MKKLFAAAALVAACFLFAAVSPARGADNASGSRQDNPITTVELSKYGKGEAFSVPANTYKLADVVFAPEYDSGDDRGYAVVFLAKEKNPPLQNPEGQDAKSLVLNDPSSPKAPKSLVALELLDTDASEFVASKSAAFCGNDTGEDSEFEGKLVFFFSVNKDKKFPRAGIFIQDDGKGKAPPLHIDLTGIEIVNTLEPLPEDAVRAATQGKK
jgi:hypothetical protein